MRLHAVEQRAVDVEEDGLQRLQREIVHPGHVILCTARATSGAPGPW